MSNVRTDILERKEDILKWIEEERTKAYIAQELHCKPSTLNNYLEKMGIEYKGQSGTNSPTRYKTTEEYLNSGSKISSHRLKIKLINDGIKEYKCEECGLTQWNNQPIPLELHHIDGNHYNNDLNNLQVICPNCHALKENNSGAALKESPEEKKKKRYTSFCIDCGKPIIASAVRCPECWHIASRKVERPDREQLKSLIREKPFTAIGQLYNVSDGAVRKWCKAENLPTKKADIKKYSDDEWTKI